MRFWVKLIQDNHLIRDTVIIDLTSDTRTHKVFHAVDKACQEFDLAKPIWLEATQKDFLIHSKTRFTKDCFVEEIDFDYMEFQVIEED